MNSLELTEANQKLISTFEALVAAQQAFEEAGGIALLEQKGEESAVKKGLELSPLFGPRLAKNTPVQDVEEGSPSGISRRQVWEHMVIQPKTNEAPARLNDLSKEGWEIVSVTEQGTWFSIILKRKVK